jgi:hypothetical protein
MVASYSGDAANNGSSSSPLSQTITAGRRNDGLTRCLRARGQAVASRSRGSPRIPRLSPERAHQSIIASGVQAHYFTGDHAAVGRRRRQALRVTSIASAAK